MSLSENFTTEMLSPDSYGIKRAVEHLRNDMLVAFPTETVFGLGGNACSDDAVARIFAAKNRPEINPLIIHVTSMTEAENFVEIPPKAMNLIKVCWPGPLTLVLPKKKKNTRLSHIANCNSDSVAVRVPAHPVARALIQELGSPVAAPSANISGKLSSTRSTDVHKQMNGRIASIIDAPQCSIGMESTIVSFFCEIPTLLRPGGIPVETLEFALGESIKSNHDITINEKSLPSPGLMTSHYAPNSTLRLNASYPNKDELYLGFGDMPPGCRGLCLSADKSLEEASANFFSTLNDLDNMAYNIGSNKIAVASIPNSGLGLAINDRLKRAAAPRAHADPPNVTK